MQLFDFEIYSSYIMECINTKVSNLDLNVSVRDEGMVF